MGIEPVRIGKLISEITTKSGTNVKKRIVSAKQILMDGYVMPNDAQLQLKEIVYGNNAPLKRFGVDKVNIFTNPTDPSYKRIEWCIGDKILAGIEQYKGLECHFSRGLKDIGNWGRGKNFFLDLLDRLNTTKRLPNINQMLTSKNKELDLNFIKNLSDKISNSKWTISALNKTEISKLAEILGTTENQILKMDAQEYRRLAKLWHPDVCEKDIGKDIMLILNNLKLKS